MRDILSTEGGVQYHGGYHECHEGYLVLWDTQYRGGYLGYHGGVQYRGRILSFVI